MSPFPPFNEAADNLAYFLSASGGTRIIDSSWLRSQDPIIAAEQTNQDRFLEKPHSLRAIAASMKPGEKKIMWDYWDVLVEGDGELYYASGDSTFRSRGRFVLEHTGCKVEITGVVQHDWYDPYDWHAGLAAYVPFSGSIPDSWGQQLVNNGKASEFYMRSYWYQHFEGEYKADGGWFYFDSFDHEWGPVHSGQEGSNFRNPELPTEGQGRIVEDQLACLKTMCQPQ